MIDTNKKPPRDGKIAFHLALSPVKRRLQ